MKSSKETDYRKVDSAATYELKKTALKLRRKGMSVTEISEVTGLARQTLYNVFNAYDEGGINAIKPKKRGRKTGEKRHLSPEQEMEIIAALVDHHPEQMNFQCCLWDRKCVQELIEQKYGIDMPIRTVGEYLKRWGFTLQRPAKQETKQKPEQLEKWLKEEYPAIRKQAAQEDAEIYWGDETTVQNAANSAPQGRTSVLKVQSVRMHINMISAISNQGKLHFLLYSEAINADKLIEFMEALLRTAEGRKVYLILDSLRVHHGKAVSAWLQKHSGKLSLFHLPPYSDEYLNRDLKQSSGSQQMGTAVSEPHDHVEG